MSIRTSSLHRLLWLTVAAQAAAPAHAAGVAQAPVRPSDCRPRDADSTCAAAVAGAPVAVPPQAPGRVLYDGTLGGVPPTGYAYWGFDFLADQTGTPSPVRSDEFVNRSAAPVTITLRFDFPTSHFCGNDCLPGVEFVIGPGWSKADPPYVFDGNMVSLTRVIAPGQGYGWVIALWQASNPRLTVSVPIGAGATLQDVGLALQPETATAIPAVTRTCDCWDATTAACSDGGRFSNGLLGPWTQVFRTYLRAGAFNNCPPQR
jgi:hypothetical protein